MIGLNPVCSARDSERENVTFRYGKPPLIVSSQLISGDPMEAQLMAGVLRLLKSCRFRLFNPLHILCSSLRLKYIPYSTLVL